MSASRTVGPTAIGRVRKMNIRCGTLEAVGLPLADANQLSRQKSKAPQLLITSLTHVSTALYLHGVTD